MSPELEKDPSEDREEFEKRLKYIFSERKMFNVDDAVKALLLNDTDKINQYVADIQALETKRTDYLTQWDAGKDKTERMNVVGSVRVD